MTSMLTRISDVRGVGRQELGDLFVRIADRTFRAEACLQAIQHSCKSSGTAAVVARYFVVEVIRPT